MQKNNAVRQYEETALGLRSTLEEKIFAELTLNPHPDWGFVLSHFTNGVKQLESLWEDIHTEFQFDLPVPCKLTATPSDKDSKDILQSCGNITTEEESFDRAIEKHNDGIIRLLQNYNFTADSLLRSKKS